MASLTSQLLVRLIDGVSGPARAASGALRGIGTAARGINGVQARLNDAIARNNAALAVARGRMVDAMAAGWALHRALSAPIRSAIDFESAMADVAKVSTFSDAALAQYGKRLRKLAQSEIPMAVTELAALSANAAQAGVPDEDLYDFTRITAKAAVAWEMTGEAAGENLAKIRTQLRLSNRQTQLFADAINHLSDNSAASAGDLVDYAKRVSAQGEFFGFAKEQTLAFGSAMIGAGAQSEVAATSFRNMGRALTRGGSASKAQRKAWKRLGMDAVKVSKAMQKDAVGTTLKVIEALGKLPDHMQAATLSDLFGDEARALAPLLNDVDQLRQALGLVADETKYADSVSREFARRAETTAYAWQRFKNQLNDVGLAIGGALLPALREIMQELGPFVLKAAEWAEANPKLVAQIIGIATALTSMRVALAGLSWLGLMGKGGALSLMAFAIGSVGKASAKAVDAVREYSRYQRRLANMAGITAAPGRLGRLGEAIRGLGQAVFGFPMRSLTALGNGLARLGWWGALAAAAGLLIYNNWSGLKEFFAGFGDAFAKGIEPIRPAIDKIKELFEPLKPILDPVIRVIRNLVNPFGTLTGYLAPMAGYLTASNEAWRAWGETMGDYVAKSVNGVVRAIRTLIDTLQAGVDKAAALGRALANIAGFGPGPDAGMPSYDANGFAIPARAGGGPIDAHQPTLVGEKGPEIITASRSGYVHSNDSLGGIGGTTHINLGGITITGVSDPIEVARLVEERLRSLIRGLQSDYGLKIW